MATKIPSVSDFVSFYELDPALDKQCIYIVMPRGTRCKFHCRPDDKARARKLYNSFIAAVEPPDLEQLQEYAKLNCCGPKLKGARHQDRIEDWEIVTPLAERWLDEIKQRIAEKEAEHHGLIVSTATTDDNAPSASLEPASTIIDSPSPTITPSLERSSSSSVPSPVPAQSTPRYDLRPSKVGRPARQSSAPARLSEFAKHVHEPEMNVVSMFRRPFQDPRDFESGQLYAFDRASSPGYVKIGWTARSVEERLRIWAKCGHPLQLVHSTDIIPHAQRIEALVHYELLCEWRRERRCKPCGQTHIEWFEISRERATHIMESWAKLFVSANPYATNGKLKDVWARVIDSVVEDGEAVTAEALLARYALLTGSESTTSVEATASDQKAALTPVLSTVGLCSPPMTPSSDRIKSPRILGIPLSSDRRFSQSVVQDTQYLSKLTPTSDRKAQFSFKPPNSEISSAEAAHEPTVAIVPSPPATPSPIFRFSMGESSPSSEQGSPKTPPPSSPRPHTEPKHFQFNYQDTKWAPALTPEPAGKTAAPRRLTRASRSAPTRSARPADPKQGAQLPVRDLVFRFEHCIDGRVKPAAGKGGLSEVVQQSLEPVEPQMVPLPPSPPPTPVLAPAVLCGLPLFAE